MKKIIHQLITVACVLFLLGSCPPNDIRVTLKNDAETTISRDKLFYLATKSQTLNDLIQDIVQQGELTEINLPNIDEASFNFLKLLSQEDLNNQQQFAEALSLEQKQKLGGFETILDMMNYLDISLPPKFKQMYANILKDRKEMAQQEKLGKRKKPGLEEAKRVRSKTEAELLTIEVPQEKGPFIGIVKASGLLTNLIKDIYEVSPEDIAPGSKITLGGNITQDEWETLLELSRNAGNNLQNFKNVDPIITQRNWNLDQLARYLQLADYLDMEVLRTVLEKHIAIKLDAFMAAKDITINDVFKKIEEIVPVTSERSTGKSLFAFSRFLPNLGWDASAVPISNIYNNATKIFEFALTKEEGGAVAVIGGVDPVMKIVYFIKGKPQMYNYNFDVHAAAFNQDGSIMAFLLQGGLILMDVQARASLAQLSTQQLAISAEAVNQPGFSFAFGPDTLIMRTPEKAILIINYKDRNNIQPVIIKGEFGYSGNIAYNASKKIIATPSTKADKIYLLDFDGSPQGELSINFPIDRLWFDVKGNLIIKSNNQILMWDTLSAKAELLLERPNARILGFNAASGNAILQDSAKFVQIINLATNEFITSFALSDEVEKIIVSEDANKFIAKTSKQILFGSNPLFNAVRNLSLMQYVTILLVAKLAESNKGKPIMIPLELEEHFKGLPEDVKKYLKTKFKIR